MATRCIAATILPAPRRSTQRRSVGQRSWVASDGRSDRSPRTARVAGPTRRARGRGARRSPRASSGSREGGQVGEHAVEALEVGGPLAVLLGRELQRQVARRRVPARAGVGQDLREPLDEVLERPAARRAARISASRMSMRAWVSRRTYETSVSSSTHSACLTRRSSSELAVEAVDVGGIEHPCAAVVCVGHAESSPSWGSRYQRPRRPTRAVLLLRLNSPRL